jgi:hypothetical protein
VRLFFQKSIYLSISIYSEFKQRKNSRAGRAAAILAYAPMEPYGLGAGGLLIEQGDPVMVSVTKSGMRLGLALWPELPDRAVVRLVHQGTAAADAGLCCFDVTGRRSNSPGLTHRPADR